jgi:hypothetical protein
MFQKICVTRGDIVQFIPFVHTFYAFEPLFYYHHDNCDGNTFSVRSH